MKKLPSKRRIIARLMLGKHVDVYDVIRHKIEDRIHAVLDEYKLTIRVTDLPARAAIGESDG